MKTDPQDLALWYNLIYRDPRHKRWVSYDTYADFSEADGKLTELVKSDRARSRNLTYRVLRCEVVIQKPTGAQPIAQETDPVERVKKFLQS